MIEITNIYPNLSDQTKFKLNGINKVKDYFNSEIQERTCRNIKCKFQSCILFDYRNHKIKK